ncbi:MAG: NADH-quinone oxidoreductase subunit NuoE [Stomatobaculum sp.]|nr:NADH-quinone oxidoreductase subunit NuoE [Stomatobaculum sp.]
MANSKTKVPFQGTPEQEQALKEVIERLKDQRGALMPILQEAQDIYGYLPEEVQRMIALGLDIPFEEVYGVATFYSQFTLNPKGQYKVSVCLGTACYVKGSGEVYARLAKELGIQGGECTADMRFSLEACRCVGACGLAPVIIINDDVYGRMTPDQVPKILAKYKEA